MADTKKVAISDNFLISYAKIPKHEQKKVREFLDAFKDNPKAKRFNYEKLEYAEDPNLYSVRIDQAYRGIVHKPKAQDTYLVVWVDHHDEAYKWAEHKLFSIHPETGALQLVDISPGMQEKTRELEEASGDGLFKDFTEHRLEKIGVPNVLLPLVKSLKRR